MVQGELTRPDGVVIRWEEEGAGDPVVLLHGLSSSARSFRRQLQGLSREFRVVALDQRGYGRSDDDPGTPNLESWTDDAAAVIEAAGAPAHLVGSSFGALVGVAVARRWPALLRSLTLIAPTLGRGGATGGEQNAWRTGRLHALDEDASVRAAKMATAGSSPEVLAAIAESVRLVRPRTYRAVVDAITETDAAPWLSGLRLPVLVMAGTEDRVTGPPVARQAAAEVSGARLALIPGAGHAAYLERPWIVNSALSAFLLEVDGAAPLKIGVCGPGTLGRQIIEGVGLGLAGPAQVVAVACRTEGGAALAELAGKLGATLTKDPEQLPQLGAEVVVEAAGPEVARRYLAAWIAGGVDVLLLSVGALADPKFEADIRRRLRRSGRRVLVPAGAVSGADTLAAAAAAGLDHINLTTVKPFGALDEATDASTGVVFRGSAREAAAAFPRNMNVAATLALAASASGAEVGVELIADRSAERNCHRLTAWGAFGRMETVTENLPSPGNPKTSYLAGLSALAALRRLRESLVIGA
ncbi:MAG: alpha/beta fold hydrolase [Candidatus Dormibacteraeota bacterium]|nr:alpha/beta fold hydrolase [Candidatus Dormibacteraeota bacterium]